MGSQFDCRFGSFPKLALGLQSKAGHSNLRDHSVRACMLRLQGLRLTTFKPASE